MDERHNPTFVKRLAGIEGLRGLAVASVLFYHVFTKNRDAGGSDLGWAGTWVIANLSHGVTLFFTLSGFLLYLPFVAAALRNTPRPSYGAYLRNRALRILPAYWVILAAVSLGLQSARVHENGRTDGVGAITDPTLLLKNAFLVQNYSASSTSTGITPAWSLAVELVFYLVLPLLVALGFVLNARSNTRSRQSVALAAPALLLGLFGLIGTFIAGKAGGLVDVSFMATAHLFALGMLVSVVYVNYHDGRLRMPKYWRPTAAALLALVLVGAVWAGQSTIPERGETILVSVSCAMLLALVVLSPRVGTSGGSLVRVLETAPLAATGVVSYSIYLWHLPIILFLRQHSLIPTGGISALLGGLLIVAAVTFGLSLITYTFVEKPAMRFKSRKREGIASTTEKAADGGQGEAIRSEKVIPQVPN